MLAETLPITLYNVELFSAQQLFTAFELSCLFLMRLSSNICRVCDNDGFIFFFILQFDHVHML